MMNAKLEAVKLINQLSALSTEEKDALLTAALHEAFLRGYTEAVQDASRFNIETLHV